MPTRRTILATFVGAALAARLSLAAAASTASATPRPKAPDPKLHDPPIRPLLEGKCPVPGGSVYYRVYGKRTKKAPIVVAHGGPAAGHRYMRPYAALATDRQVVMWDQLGCGRSDTPADTKLWTVDRFVAEFDALRAHLKFDRFVALGHSWGGWLSQSYALAHGDRLAALVLAGTSASIPDMQRAADAYVAEYGPGAVAVAKKAMETGNYETPEVGELLMRFYSDHLCRLDPWPQWFAEEGEKIAKNPVYQYMNGPSEFAFTGSLKDLDMTAELHRIKAPTLITCGQFDYGSPACAANLQKGIAGSKVVVYDGLSHMSHIEDPARVVKTVRGYLDAIRV